MCDTGLSKEHLTILNSVFSRYPDVEQVKIYGSRAKGNYHDRSDIDLVVFGKGLNRADVAAMLMDLDDSDIPYLVDLQDYQDLKNKKLIDHINRVGCVIYTSDSSQLLSGTKKAL